MIDLQPTSVDRFRLFSHLMQQDGPMVVRMQSIGVSTGTCLISRPGSMLSTPRMSLVGLGTSTPAAAPSFEENVEFEALQGTMRFWSDCCFPRLRDSITTGSHDALLVGRECAPHMTRSEVPLQIGDNCKTSSQFLFHSSVM